MLVSERESATESRISEIIAEHQGLEGPLLPIFHAIQHEFGFIPDSCLPQIAQALTLSRAEVYGVLTFYHDFRTHPHGQHVVKLCRAEACQSMGADRIHAHAKGRLGLDWHQTSPDGRVTLEPVFCLGLCACAPAAMVDGRVIGRVDEAAVDRIAAEVGA
ncbi:MAG: formate dehydrogenase subunit gamma [Paracoccaceae bacterium]